MQSVLSTVFPVPPLSISSYCPYLSTESVFCQGTLFCPCPNLLFLLNEGYFSLGLFDIVPSSWLLCDYFCCLLDLFLLIYYLPKSGTASQNNKEPLFISTLTPKVVYHYQSLAKYLQGDNCKILISSAEISPLDWQYRFQTCVLCVYIWVFQSYCKLNMSILSNFETFPENTFSLIHPHLFNLYYSFGQIRYLKYALDFSLYLTHKIKFLDNSVFLQNMPWTHPFLLLMILWPYFHK